MLHKAGEVTSPLVLVEWVDSLQPEPGWTWLSGFNPKLPCICRSVGWLVYDGEDVKAIAPNSSVTRGGDVQVSGIIHIPTVAIRDILHLEESE